MPDQKAWIGQNHAPSIELAIVCKRSHVGDVDAPTNELESAEMAANVLRSAPRGRLRISAPLHFGANSLTPSLAEFSARYPELEVDLVLNDRASDLAKDRLDAAFVFGPDDIATRRLVRVLPSCEAPPRSMSLVYLPDSKMTPKVRVLWTSRLSTLADQSVSTLAINLPLQLARDHALRVSLIVARSLIFRIRDNIGHTRLA